MVKGKGRPHDPHNFAMGTLVAEQLVQFVIVPGKGRFPGASLAEGKYIPLAVTLAKAIGVDIYPLLAVFCAAHGHQVTCLQQAELAHHHAPGLQHGHAIHAAVLRQQPGVPHMKIFRENAHGVITHGCYAVLGRGEENSLWSVAQILLRKVRRGIGPQHKGHKGRLPFRCIEYVS